uniref:Uncharacterized protein n=1 Tax=Anguilla anguilla TaxID=7936 RepID=A0A0E9T2K2_ANGAN
MQCKLFVKS